jgi:glycerate-2-kinase
MLFLNKQELLNNTSSGKLQVLRTDAIDILEKAVAAVEPKKALKKVLKIEKEILDVGKLNFNIDKFAKIKVIGGGKASGAMAEAIEEILGDRISEGKVNVNYDLKKIKLVGASHPIPGEDGVKGVTKMLKILENTQKDELVIVLISGGGSALMPCPVEGIPLQDFKKITESLLLNGATINELNAVRKHISAIKGGQLAKRAYPSTIISFILSDVIGDPLDTIASGPTAPDHTTFHDAVRILKNRKIWKETPKSIQIHLEKGKRQEVEETPKNGDKVFDRVHNILIGSNLVASLAAVKRSKELGYNSMLLSTRVEGEAREVGIALAGITKEITITGNPVISPGAIIVGGETTVTVTGNGRGGRNMELALGAMSKISGMNAVLVALATDGIDGPTESAGAIVDGYSLLKAENIGLNAEEFLNRNDSFTFFDQVNDTLKTGPTGTNVNDLTVILVAN